MPFQSEKQRRFLWAKHPEIAKRWAHKYPDSNKNLPMYAKDKTESEKPTSKAAALNVLRSAFVNNWNFVNKLSLLQAGQELVKNSDSKLTHIEMPQDPEPTYAGEKQITSILKPESEDEGSVGDVRRCEEPKNITNPLLSKLAVVLSPRIQQEIEDRKAQEQARMAQRVPENVNVKKYPMPSATIPPPMGMAQAPQAPQQPTQPQQAAPAQPDNGQLASVGGGNSPNANPINSYGGLSSTGDINGNAAFGTANSMGGEKLAAQKCSCGCGQTVADCSCPVSCSCRQKGGSCYGKKTAAPKQAADASQFDISKFLSELGQHPAEQYENSAEAPDYAAEDTEPNMPAIAALLGLGGLAGYVVNDKPRMKRSHVAMKQAQPVNTLFPTFEQRKALGAEAMGKIMGKRPRTLQAQPKAEVKPPVSAPPAPSGEKWSAVGLWDRIRAKKQRGEKPAKPGDKDYPDAKSWKKVTSISEKQADSPAWQRSAGKNEEGGLNEKGRKSYEREHGGNLKPPVTESNPTGDRAKRQNSFCSRMCGMKRVNTGASTAKDPDSRINKSLRKWNCKCSSAMAFGEKLAQELQRL